MCFRDRFTKVWLKENKLETKNFYKKKDMKSTIKAEFKYLLYNYHEEKFKVKQSFESRLFNPTSLANLDEVQNDIKEALKSCVKLPQLAFVLFYVDPRHRGAPQKFQSDMQQRGIPSSDFQSEKTEQSKIWEDESDQINKFLQLRDGLF